MLKFAPKWGADSVFEKKPKHIFGVPRYYFHVFSARKCGLYTVYIRFICG